MFRSPRFALLLLLSPIAAFWFYLICCKGASAHGNTGFVAPIARMMQARSGHSATLLPDGKVLIAGGMVRNGEFLRTAELYDPATKSFSRTGDMAMERVGQSSAILRDGKVLIAGGWKMGSG